VLRGDMSLAGPRPVVDAEVPHYGASWPLYTLVKPGLTGLWQVSGRNDTTYRRRVELDAAYVRNWNLSLDFLLLFKTARVILTGKGAY
jgi:lipopolysaccharide/colanic/teichoic acid biosynthesis glycosyltransferase